MEARLRGVAERRHGFRPVLFYGVAPYTGGLKIDLENPFCFAGQISRYLARGEDLTGPSMNEGSKHRPSYRSPPLPRMRRHSISHTVTAGKGGCEEPLPLIKFL